MSTEQKVVVITGASQGIGAALVKAYREQNYRVVAVSRTIEPSEMRQSSQYPVTLPIAPQLTVSMI